MYQCIIFGVGFIVAGVGLFTNRHGLTITATAATVVLMGL